MKPGEVRLEPAPPDAATCHIPPVLLSLGTEALQASFLFKNSITEETKMINKDQLRGSARQLKGTVKKLPGRRPEAGARH